ncbi:MAG: hypothetical protein ACPG19_16015, partial [Saprospiraceae bacterium]
MKRKALLVLVLAIFSSAILQAQNADRRDRLEKEKKGITYDTELAGNIKLLTNGWSIGGHYGIIKNYYTTNTFNFEFGELKHVREASQRSNSSTPLLSRSSRAFIYGKKNNLYALRASIGQKRYFSEKARRKGVAVGISYNFGASFGIIKPYYLEISKTEPGSRVPNIYDLKYTEENELIFLGLADERIHGASSIGMGLDEISIAPGGYAKIALHLDWGAYEETIKALEVGISADFYLKNVELMVTDDNRPFFVNFYAA